MHDTNETLTQLRELLRTQRFAVLATRRADAQPYGNLVAFACDEALGCLLFATQRATRKYQNIEAEPRVALVVDNRANSEDDLRRAMVVTALGRAVETEGEQRRRMIDLFCDKHPAMREFVDSPESALLRVDIERYIVVRQFQKVVEMLVQDGDIRLA